MRHPFRFRPNHPDELHCVPCAVGMALEGLTGVSLDDAELERVCGFVPGLEVWQFGWMLNLADRGLRVRSVEDFDAAAFVADPRGEMLRQTGGDESIVERIYEVSDVEAQVPLVRSCLSHPNIAFEQIVPSYAALVDALGSGSAALINLNVRVLNGREGYAGHLVLVHREGDELVVEDPGPPAQQAQRVDEELFARAWTSPSEGMANFILVSVTR